jgi:Integrin beta chain VWA domain
MSLRVIITAALAALLCGTAGGARLSQPLDVELAIDTTGSMGPSIKRMQRDAAKLVTDLRTRFPAARFALVQFKDAADTPEYEVLQSMTSDPKLVAQATARMGPGGGGDNPEAYNVVFRNSYADESIGWRADSRKLVVVVGDAEPHGAGSAGLAGCLDASADPHALRVRQELVGMKVNGRTLIMIRQASTASAALDCFEALAEQTF